MTGQTGSVELVLTGGTIYAAPTEDPIANGVVVIRDGRIADIGRQGSVVIPEAAARLDCSGLTVAAGFWNSHVHFMERKWADAATHRHVHFVHLKSAADVDRQLVSWLAKAYLDSPE
jgi:predicted amidohydrolase YtcJ